MLGTAVGDYSQLPCVLSRRDEGRLSGNGASIAGREREREKERQREWETEREREGDRERKRERDIKGERDGEKILILKIGGDICCWKN